MAPAATGTAALAQQLRPGKLEIQAPPPSAQDDTGGHGASDGGEHGSAPSTAPSTPTTPAHSDADGGGSSSPGAAPLAANGSSGRGMIPSFESQQPPQQQQQQQQQRPPPPSLSSSLAPAAGESPSAPYKVLAPPSPPPPGLLGRLQTAWAVCFLGLMGSCLYLILATAAYIVVGLVFLGHRAVPCTLAALWVAQALAPIKQFQQDPPAMRDSWLFKEMARYFNMRAVIESKLDTSKHYLFAQFPHGTVPLGAVLSAHYVEEVVPGRKILCLIHTGIMHLPIVRFFMGHWGALTADRENVAEARRRAGANCSILVGGVAEIFLQNEATECLRLRKGFIREALRNGMDLVPMFNYGTTRMYKFIGSPSFWRRVSAKLPFPFFLIEGWGRVTLIPKKVPILLAVGSPLGAQALAGVKEQEPIADPDPEVVDRVYAAFKAELRALYYRYRPEWETRELEIVDA